MNIISKSVYVAYIAFYTKRSVCAAVWCAAAYLCYQCPSYKNVCVTNVLAPFATPIQTLLAVFATSLLNLVKTQTNRYVSQMLADTNGRTWKTISLDMLYKLFAVVVRMSGTQTYYLGNLLDSSATAQYVSHSCWCG